MDMVIAVSRYLLPIITILILSKCILTLLLGRAKDTTYAYIIDTTTNARYALNMWETALGKSNSCDIVLSYDDLAKFQAVICRRNDSWYIYDLISKNPTKVNSVSIKKRAEIANFDTIKFGSRTFSFRVVADPVQNHKGNKTPQQVKPTPATKKSPNDDSAALPMNNMKSSTANTNTTLPKRRKPALVNAITKQIHVISKNPTRIGSAMQCEIHLNIANSAITHAMITLYDEGWAIEKIGNSSCYLNGSMITQTQLLFENDVIKIAGQKFYYTYNYGSSI